MPSLKVVYCGTPSFVIDILKVLLKDKRFEIPFIVTQQDKPAGRSKKLTSQPLRVFGELNNLIVQQPAKIKNLAQELTAVKPDFLVVFAYGQIFPKQILEIPKFGCVNIHLSLLPKYRGASPVQEAILSEDKETGVTFMLMEEALDTGPVLARYKLPMRMDDTTQTLFEKLSRLAAQELPATLVDFANGKIKPVPQNYGAGSYCRKIKKEDGLLNPSRETAREMVRKIRAYTPWPGCFIFLKDKRIKITQAEACEQKNSSNINRVFIATKKGFLTPLRLQVEGKNEMETVEFLRGNSGFFA